MSSKEILENHIKEKGFLIFCELWTNVFVSYGQRYAQLFSILSNDLQMHLGL